MGAIAALQRGKGERVQLEVGQRPAREHGRGGANVHLLEGQVTELTEENGRLKDDFAKLRTDSAKEVRRLKGEARVERAKLADLQKAYDEARNGLGLAESALAHRADRLEAALDDERAALRRAEAKHDKEAARLGRLLEKETSACMALRAKMRDLTRRLVAAERRANGGGGLPSSASGYGSGRGDHAAGLPRGL